jgi:hypothetical protein
MDTIIYVLYDHDPDDPIPYRTVDMSLHKTLLGAKSAASKAVTDGRPLEWEQPPEAFYWIAGKQFRVEAYPLED